MNSTPGKTEEEVDPTIIANPDSGNKVLIAEAFQLTDIMKEQL
jgi:hypothetical protein